MILLDRIILSNCNCIESAEINVIPNYLNIKYGLNGTGKSTFGRAIYLAAKNEKLDELIPYGASSDITPYVEGIENHNVMVFNDDYVSESVLQRDNFFENPYLIFMNTGECDQLENKINELLNDLQGMIQEEDELIVLQNLLESYFKIFNFNGTNIEKKGGVGEFLKGNGAGFEKHPELDSYKPFYQEQDFKKLTGWANWRRDGIDKISNNQCPFCTTTLKSEITTQNQIIEKVFKKAALSKAFEILTYLNQMSESGYVIKDVISKIEGYAGNISKKDELDAELSKLGMETEYFQKKIIGILAFRPMNVSQEQLNKIDEYLSQLIIDTSYVSSFYGTEKTYDIIDRVNAKIEVLLEKTRQLKSLFEAHEKKLLEIVEKQKDDINEFLAIAGFPYKFELLPDGEKRARAYLTPSGDTAKVENPDKHLSWGEKNAFSLVMFMFEAISKNADLIILDDPISSFHVNKKFGVIRRLFDDKKKSFRGKTVLMFTHDMQPIIDYVHGAQFSKMGLQTHVYTTWIRNENGIIHEELISKDDLKNAVLLSNDLYCNAQLPIHVRIVNYRKYIELTNMNYKEDATYQALSNLIQGRENQTEEDGSTLLPQDLIDEANLQLSQTFEGLKYNEILNLVKDSDLLQQINNGGAYEKVLAFRLLFERHKDKYRALRKSEPAIYKFLNESNHIENDYIFQLDPYKYYVIPEFYLEKLMQVIDGI